MAPVSSKSVDAKKAALSQHELLDKLVGIVTKHANEQLIGVGTRLISALLDVTDTSMEPRTVFLHVKAGNLLKENNYAYVHLASNSLEMAMRREVKALSPGLKKALSSPAVLSLVPFEEMDSKVAFDAISRPFEMQYASQIATLNVRLGSLLNRDILRLPQNPFRPEMFLSALHQAWQEFEPDVETHGLIVPMLKPALMWDFAPMYDALCEALIGKGQRGDTFSIRKTENAAAAKAARAKEQADLAKKLRQFMAGGGLDGMDGDIPMIPDLPDMPSTGGGWRPSGAPSFQGAMAEVMQAKQPTHSGHPQSQAHAQQGGFAATRHPGHAAPAGGFMVAPQGGHAMPGGHFINQASVGAALGQAGFGAAPAPLIDMLKALQARMPEQFSATPSSMQAGAPVQNADVFYLPRLKESIPKGTLTRGDESTIDLLSKIFETVFLDPNIPKDIRDLIQFLQIPVLKAALVDKNFFFEEAHPARRMINMLSSMGLEQRQVDDPVFQAMQRSVDKVGREADDSVSVFQAAVAELEESIKEEEAAATTAIAEPIKAALKQEKVYAATRSAKTAVAARVSSGEVVAVLETFLEHKWTSVLTVAYSVEEEKPGAVGNATKTMDDLIWSVKPKITHAERKALINKLPGLLATLNKWLDIIKWQDADRLQFFAELAECHASIVRAPLDITPERQLEIAVEVAQADAMRRLEKEKEAEKVDEEVDIDDAALTVETLERGAWLEFPQTDGSMRKAKLAWVSPLKTLFIFSLGARQESFSLSAEKLTLGFRNDKIKVVRMDGVVERALSEAMGGGAVNDSSMSNVA